MRKIKGKKAIALRFLGWLLIAVAILVIILYVYYLSSKKGISALGFIKDLFRFKS